MGYFYGVPMKSVYDYRCENLKKIRKEFNSIRELADFIGTSKQSMGQLLNGNRKLGTNLARKIETKMGLPTNHLDQSSTEISEEVRDIAIQIAERIVELNASPEKILAIIDAIYAEKK